MTIIQNIIKEQISARKNQEGIKSSILTTLIGESQTIAKNLNQDAILDEDITKLITKFIKNMNETIQILQGKNDQKSLDTLTLINTEKDILSQFLPSQDLMSESMLRVTVLNIINTNKYNSKDMGKVMAELKLNHANKYDPKTTSELIKRLLPTS